MFLAGLPSYKWVGVCCQMHHNELLRGLPISGEKPELDSLLFNEQFLEVSKKIKFYIYVAKLLSYMRTVTE